MLALVPRSTRLPPLKGRDTISGKKTSTRRCKTSSLVLVCIALLVITRWPSSDENLVLLPTASITMSNQIVSSQTTRTTTFQTIHLANNNNNPDFVNATIVSRKFRPLRENAIVFLVQKKHSTYQQRDSYGFLLQCLDLLYQNYLSLNQSDAYHNLDIFLFHTGDFDPHDLDIIEPHVTGGQQQHAGIVKLVNLNKTPYWNLPQNLRQDDASEWLDFHLFPVGYRHMCRFFAVKIWDFFHTLSTQHPAANYRFLWRLDEDSLIHSKIPYNMFDFMRQHQYVYGYRMCSYELGQNKFVPHWFEKWHTKVKPQRTIDWRLCGFYNNFFVADLQFFRNKRVQAFLHEIDRRGFMYRKRYGDLVVHSMLVYAFGQAQQIHRFLDFTYEHVTVDKRVNPNGCVIWGAIQAGYLDDDPSLAMQIFQQKYHLLGRQGHRCAANISHLTYEDLSPTYSHLANDWKSSISLKTISAGKVEMVGKGILSG